MTTTGLCEEQEDRVVVRQGRGGAARGGPGRGGAVRGGAVRGGAVVPGRERGVGRVAKARRRGQ